MSTISHFRSWTSILAGIAISTVNLALLAPRQVAIAQTPTLCRAANIDTPIFKGSSTISEALRIINKDAEITLKALPPSGSQFAEITAPLAGFVQTAVLKQCGITGGGGSWDKPTTGTACRRLIQPTIGVNVRRQPKANGDYVATILPPRNVTVNLTTGGVVKSYRADGYDWVELDLRKTLGANFSGSGWIFNTDLKTSPTSSNLVLCP